MATPLESFSQFNHACQALSGSPIPSRLKSCQDRVGSPFDPKYIFTPSTVLLDSMKKFLQQNRKS